MPASASAASIFFVMFAASASAAFASSSTAFAAHHVQDFGNFLVCGIAHFDNLSFENQVFSCMWVIQVKYNFIVAYFSHVGGDTGSFPCKPDPSLAQYAALSLRVAPSECAFVGDGETDAMVARNAGMFGVSVLWGYRTQEELSRVGASRFVSSYEELFRVLTTF